MLKEKTPTPPGSRAGLPSPYVPTTPNNPTEARSHTDYIINRIRRHQNSSPTSIIDAIRQQGKATQVTMHRYTLIDEEFKISREELAAISKGRRAKKTRIRHKGSLSVNQAQDLIAQKDVDGQVAKESRRSGGGVSQSESTGRKCGNCGQTGHNIRTCDVYVDYVGEDDSE